MPNHWESGMWPRNNDRTRAVHCFCFRSGSKIEQRCNWTYYFQGVFILQVNNSLWMYKKICSRMRRLLGNLHFFTSRFPFKTEDRKFQRIKLEKRNAEWCEIDSNALSGKSFVPYLLYQVALLAILLATPPGGKHVLSSSCQVYNKETYPSLITSRQCLETAAQSLQWQG